MIGRGGYFVKFLGGNFSRGGGRTPVPPPPLGTYES